MRNFNAIRNTGAAALALLSTAAMAVPLDVAELKTTIEGTLTPVGVIGLAVLGVVVGVKVFKWIRSAL